METAKGVPKSPVDIIDIRCEELDESLLKLMLSSLDPDDRGPRALSTLLLYDGRPTDVWLATKPAHTINRGGIEAL